MSKQSYDVVVIEGHAGCEAASARIGKYSPFTIKRVDCEMHAILPLEDKERASCKKIDV